MMRTQVARKVRDELHAAEASMETALADARRTLERLVSAKTELGLTGSMGDAAIARMRDSVAALEDARQSMIESHMESYTVLKATNIRGVAISPTVFQEASYRQSEVA
jgi:hypothetical protein